MILDHAHTRPHELALDDLTRQRTWADLVDRATRLAHHQRDQLALGPDDHVAVLMGNRVEFVEIILGALMAGIWITPINWHLQADEIAYIVRDSEARVLFTDDGLVDMARAAVEGDAIAGGGEAGAPAIVTAGAPAIVTAGHELDALLAAASPEPWSLDGPAGGTMIYTSGTTGRPKGVQRARPASLRAALEGHGASGRALGLDGAGAHLVTGPLYHAAPLLFAFYDLANGAPMVIMPRWDAEQALALIRERAVAHAHLVPTMFVRLQRLPATVRAAFDPAPLRLVLHGAAPVGSDVKRNMIAWWGEILVEYWGATEGGFCTLVDSRDWLAHEGTVGRATPTFEVFAVDDDGARLPAGETGVLYCRHRTLDRVFEYHRDPAKTAAAFRAPGTFTTGDVGFVDTEGYVYLSDRQSNMIISGGVNIYPAEIEHVFQGHPAVADVAVFGIPDDEWGESVHAAVELEHGVEPTPDRADELRAFARERLARYKIPRAIDFHAALPRHPTGKLLVRLLREPFWKDRTRRI